MEPEQTTISRRGKALAAAVLVAATLSVGGAIAATDREPAQAQAGSGISFYKGTGSSAPEKYYSVELSEVTVVG
jgi:hypothetical protein